MSLSTNWKALKFWVWSADKLDAYTLSVKILVPLLSIASIWTLNDWEEEDLFFNVTGSEVVVE